MKAPLAVIRAMRATRMLIWGRIIEMLTKFLTKKFKTWGRAMKPLLRQQSPEQMKRTRRVQRLPALAMMKGTDQQGISTTAPRK